MKHLKLFELFSIENVDDNIKNIADDIFNKIQDELDPPLRILIKKTKGKMMAATGYDYRIEILIKLSVSDFPDTTLLIYLKSKLKDIANAAKWRFKIPVRVDIYVTPLADTFVYSQSQTNNEPIKRKYLDTIIYDTKSDSYIEDTIQ